MPVGERLERLWMGAVVICDKVYTRISLKLKVKSSLCLSKHHAMKAYWGVEV
jgi:hypothetical protein